MRPQTQNISSGMVLTGSPKTPVTRARATQHDEMMLFTTAFVEFLSRNHTKSDQPDHRGGSAFSLAKTTVFAFGALTPWSPRHTGEPSQRNSRRWLKAKSLL